MRKRHIAPDTVLAAVLALLLAALPLRADTVLDVPYSDLAKRLDGRITFDTLPARPEPGLSFDHPLGIEGARVGAAFAGQVSAIRRTRTGTRHDALDDARATAPLRLVGHGPGRGLTFAQHRGFGSVAVFPLGPDGLDAVSGRGEGTLAVLFEQDQSAFGLRIHSDYPDPLGTRVTPPGGVTVIALARDGRVIARHDAPLSTGITDLGLARADRQHDIAGFVLLNSDPGGIAVDDILFARAALLGTPLTPMIPPRRMARNDKGQGTMAKGYWVGHVDVDDPQVYEEYKRANAAPFAEFGARFIVRGGQQSVPEGAARGRTVVIEFPSYQDALDCFHSPAYQQAKALRDPVSRADMVIVEGYDG